jgi:hypothetical protein
VPKDKAVLKLVRSYMLASNLSLVVKLIGISTIYFTYIYRHKVGHLIEIRLRVAPFVGKKRKHSIDCSD